MSVVVTIANEPSVALLEAVNRLLPQLSSTASPLTDEDLSRLVSSPGTSLFVASVDGEMVGVLTLVLFTIPSGRRAWIEDVVVDVSARKSGVGAALTRSAIDAAREWGARTVDLTSRPSRTSANALYRTMGFVLRETNVYRCFIENSSDLGSEN